MFLYILIVTLYIMESCYSWLTWKHPFLLKSTYLRDGIFKVSHKIRNHKSKIGVYYFIAHTLHITFPCVSPCHIPMNDIVLETNTRIE
jgi:hypothetical protein